MTEPSKTHATCLDGGPAFPFPTMEQGSTCTAGAWAASPGMSLRDYFAAAAMAALIAKIPLHDRLVKIGVHAPAIEDIQRVRLDVAQSAYDYADAMLRAREGGAS